MKRYNYLGQPLLESGMGENTSVVLRHHPWGPAANRLS